MKKLLIFIPFLFLFACPIKYDQAVEIYLFKTSTNEKVKMVKTDNYGYDDSLMNDKKTMFLEDYINENGEVKVFIKNISEHIVTVSFNDIYMIKPGEEFVYDYTPETTDEIEYKILINCKASRYSTSIFGSTSKMICMKKRLHTDFFKISELPDDIYIYSGEAYFFNLDKKNPLNLQIDNDENIKYFISENKSYIQYIGSEDYSIQISQNEISKTIKLHVKPYPEVWNLNKNILFKPENIYQTIKVDKPTDVLFKFNNRSPYTTIKNLKIKKEGDPSFTELINQPNTNIYPYSLKEAGKYYLEISKYNQSKVSCIITETVTMPENPQLSDIEISGFCTEFYQLKLNEDVSLNNFYSFVTTDDNEICEINKLGTLKFKKCGIVTVKVIPGSSESYCTATVTVKPLPIETNQSKMLFIETGDIYTLTYDYKAGTDILFKIEDLQSGIHTLNSNISYSIKNKSTNSMIAEDLRPDINNPVTFNADEDTTFEIELTGISSGSCYINIID